MPAVRVAIVLLCTGCRPAPPLHPREPSAPPAVAPAAHDEPRLQVSFAIEGEGRVEIVAVRGRERRAHAVPDGTTRTGPALATTSFSSVGVVATLDAWIDDAPADVLAVEVAASEACDAPWILDLDAPALGSRGRWRGSPHAAASVRIGCGPVQHAVFVGEHGEDRTVFYGASAFDTRSVAGEIAVLRSQIERAFGVAVGAAWRTEVVLGAGTPDAIVRPPHVVAVERGITMALDADRGWSAESRLALAATLAGVWLRRALGPSDALAERAVVAGLARGIAREEVFALGLISPDEYADDLDRDEARIAEARAVARRGDGRWLAGLAAVHAVDVAIATWIVRERGGVGIVGTLIDRTRSGSASQRWAAVLAELDAAPVPGPGDDPLARPRARRRLGRCIAARTRTIAITDPGFDLAPEPDARGLAVVAGIVPGGAAERANLAVGDALVAITEATGSVVVLRADGPVVVELPGAPRRTSRRGWQRIPTIADDRCYPR